MEDVERINVPIGPFKSPEPDKKGEVQQFKEWMQDAQKVGAVDSEQKKKRKNKQQAEEEQQIESEGLIAAQANKQTPLPITFSTNTSPAQKVEGVSLEPSSNISLGQKLSEISQPLPTVIEERIPLFSSISNDTNDTSLGTSSGMPLPLVEQNFPLMSHESISSFSQETHQETQSKKQEEVATSSMASLDTSSFVLQTPYVDISFPQASSTYPFLPRDVRELFDFMVGAITIASIGKESELSSTTLFEGDQETVITLNADHFNTSVFYDSQIIIRRYGTAPGEYNVEFIGNPAAVQMFTAHQKKIATMFDSGNYKFKVRNITVSLASTTSNYRMNRTRE